MFRKLVSNLPFSPALITEVGFYANRLRDEEVTRRATVFFVILALIMQSLAVFSPPESANASSEQDIVRGGVVSLEDFLLRYDHNEEDLHDIYSTAGVSRTEIAAAKPGYITARENTYVMSRFGQISTASNEVSMAYQRSAGGAGVRYFSPLKAIGGENRTYSGWVGHSATLGWFGIVKASGSLATKGLPTTVNPANATLASTTRSVAIANLTQKTDGSTSTAQPLDKLSYSLNVRNSNSHTVTEKFSIRIADILEYATLIDGGGATYDSDTNTLNWPTVQLAAGDTQERTFAVQLLSQLPSTPVGLSNASSYDCKMSLSFGTTSHTNVACPSIKGIEGVLSQLPRAGIGLNVAFATAMLFIVTYFYVRTRQLRKEIRIIRHNFNTGII